MTWIKRNLALVISGVVALGLVGFGVVYLLGAVGRNETMDNEIGQAKSELERLMSEDPFPSSSNIALARRELERVNAFIAESKKLFPATPSPAQALNNQTFKSLLQTTIANLHSEAAAAGIRFESNYYFSFEAQRLPISFPTESLQPLSERLREVQTVSSVLFKSKVNRLESVRRARVPGESMPGTDYLTETVRLSGDAGMALWPYEYTFHCFSPELASVMEGVMRAPQMAVIRSVVVEPAPEVARMVQPPAPGARTNLPPRIETILNERALRVVMKLDVIKPAGPAELGDPGGPGRGGMRPPP